MEVKPEALVHATFRFFKRTVRDLPRRSGARARARSLPAPAPHSHSQATSISQSFRLSAAESEGQKIDARDPARIGRGCGAPKSGSKWENLLRVSGRQAPPLEPAGLRGSTAPALTQTTDQGTGSEAKPIWFWV